MIAIFIVMSLSIVPWEACPLKLIIFRFCMVLSPPVGICACWVLPACAASMRDAMQASPSCNSTFRFYFPGVCCCQGSDLVCISFWSRFWSRFSRLRFPGPFPFPALLWLLFGIFGWCSCLPLALFFGQVLLVDVCCSWSPSLLGRCFLSLPVQCCWVGAVEAHQAHHAKCRWVGDKWDTSGDKWETSV